MGGARNVFAQILYQLLFDRPPTAAGGHVHHRTRTHAHAQTRPTRRSTSRVSTSTDTRRARDHNNNNINSYNNNNNIVRCSPTLRRRPSPTDRQRARDRLHGRETGTRVRVWWFWDVKIITGQRRRLGVDGERVSRRRGESAQRTRLRGRGVKPKGHAKNQYARITFTLFDRMTID